MKAEELRALAEALASGEITVDAALAQFKTDSVLRLEEATLDLERGLRQGVPEVIYGAGKTADQIRQIAEAMLAAGETDVLITRLDAGKAEILSGLPHIYYADARIAVLAARSQRPARGLIAVVSAGTSDQPVAEEAAVVAEVLGNRVLRIRDVGVAGLHRLLERTKELRAAKAIIVVAGMEGALPTVVGGLVDVPVIGVPTSVGYGASFGGVAALLGMLNSCASGLVVVNIDNGFGAAFHASRINQLCLKGENL